MKKQLGNNFLDLQNAWKYAMREAKEKVSQSFLDAGFNLELVAPPCAMYKGEEVSVHLRTARYVSTYQEPEKEFWEANITYHEGEHKGKGGQAKLEDLVPIPIVSSCCNSDKDVYPGWCGECNNASKFILGHSNR